MILPGSTCKRQWISTSQQKTGLVKPPALQALASIDLEKNENEAAYLKLQKVAEISKNPGDQGGGFAGNGQAWI